MLTLDIAIATYKSEGISKIEELLLPPIDNVRYIISWQQHENAPIPDSILKRDDVSVSRIDQPGLSNNRNNSFRHGAGDIILVADDDIDYNAEGIKSLIKAFEENPEMDAAIVKIDLNNKKKYPSDGTIIGVPFPKGYFCNSPEIAIRRDKINDLQFYPKLGLGSKDMWAGEEELFLVSAIKRGLKIRFLDIEIGVHSAESTGDKVNPGILRGQGFVISAIYPWSFLLRIPLKALRLKKSGKSSLFKSAFYLYSGSMKKILTWHKIPKCYRW